MAPNLALELPVFKTYAEKTYPYLSPLSQHRSPVKTFKDSTCVSCKAPSPVPNTAPGVSRCSVGNIAGGCNNTGLLVILQLNNPGSLLPVDKYLTLPLQALPSPSNFPRFTAIEHLLHVIDLAVKVPALPHCLASLKSLWINYSTLIVAFCLVGWC